jgi:integrase
MKLQPTLFNLPSSQTTDGRFPRGPLDPASEALLIHYRQSRLDAGANPNTVAREVSQLRSLARAAEGQVALQALFADPLVLAQALLDPTAPISASTGRCRLIAAQRFIHQFGARVGIENISQFLAALDRLLPARTQRDWQASGTIVAGAKTRRRPQGPTLSPVDLERIVEAVDASRGYRGRRDRALVALHCYSGLRPSELVALRRCQVVINRDSEQLWVQLCRGGRLLRLLLAGPAASPLLAICWPAIGDLTATDGYHIFRRVEHRDQPLSLRAVRKIVQHACNSAGFPLASAADLRAAFATWLRAQGLSDHETAEVLGLEQVRTLDRLVARHVALDAQRQVREILES